MSLTVKDSASATKYLETGAGDGTSGDPFVSPTATVLRDVWDDANDRLNVNQGPLVDTVDVVSLGTETVAAIVGTGAKTIGNADQEQLTASSIAAKKGVVVKAKSTNSGIVYVGKDTNVTANSDDATDGYPLSAGESISLPVANANLVWLIADAASQKVFFLVV